MTACDLVEPECKSSVTFINKTPEALKITVNGSIPSGCGYVGPGESCSANVSPDVTFNYAATGSNKGNWSGSDAVPKCTNTDISLIY